MQILEKFVWFYLAECEFKKKKDTGFEQLNTLGIYDEKGELCLL